MTTNYETLVDVVVKAEIAGNARHEINLHLGDTPACLLAAGLLQRPIILKAATIGKIFWDHGLTQKQIARLPALLQAPREIFKSDTRGDSVVVVTIEVKGVSPVVICIAKDRRVGRDLVHVITSVYAKTGPDPVPVWTAKGLLLWK